MFIEFLNTDRTIARVVRRKSLFSFRTEEIILYRKSGCHRDRDSCSPYITAWTFEDSYEEDNLNYWCKYSKTIERARKKSFQNWRTINDSPIKPKKVSGFSILTDPTQY